MKDLSPTVFRQRLVIEGKAAAKISSDQIKDYLSKLSDVLEMKPLLEPVTNLSKFGWAGWIHWELSGTHFYTWDYPFPFFSVDIYTCKKFDEQKAVEFTKNFFKASEIVSKSF